MDRSSRVKRRRCFLEKIVLIRKKHFFSRETYLATGDESPAVFDFLCMLSLIAIRARLGAGEVWGSGRQD